MHQIISMNISEHTLEEFRKGNIEPLYLEIYPSLLRYAERVLGESHAHEAEDCVQEAIYKVYLSRREFNSPMHMRTFMYTCIHNEIISLHRKQEVRYKFQDLQREDMEESLFDNLVLQETLDQLYQAIDALPPHLHEIFEMSFEQGLQNIEIAKLLQVSPETIKKRKAKLVSVLRDQFRDEKNKMLLLYIFLQAIAFD